MIKKVNIGGMKYTVKAVKDLTSKKAESRHDPEGENNGAWGLINWHNQTIYVEDDFTEIRKKTILVHECIHGIVDQGALSYDDKQEEYCRALSYGLVRLIKDNPELIKYIQEKEIEPK